METTSLDNINRESWLRVVLREHTTIVVFLVMFFICSLLSNKFCTAPNLSNVMRQTVPLGIGAMGMLFVILTGGIDLSVGSILAVGNVSLVMLSIRYNSIGVGIALSLLLCCAFGLISGLIVTKGNINPFVTTLAMMTILRGIAMIITGGQPMFVENDDFVNLSNASFLGIPYPFLLLIAFVVICHILLRYTVFGRIIVAVGSNETAAKYAAIKVDVYKTLAYVFCGFAYGLAAVVVSSRTSVGSPKVGEGYELDSIAAVVIGGASLKGGRGTVINTLIGALIISMISNIMNLMNLSGYHQRIVKGIIILLAVLAESLKNRRTE